MASRKDTTKVEDANVQPADTVTVEAVVATIVEAIEYIGSTDGDKLVDKNTTLDPPSNTEAQVTIDNGTKKPTPATQEIPEYALPVLKVFCNAPELYVGKTGGAYAFGTPSAVRGAAILFKNPFYQPK